MDLEARLARHAMAGERTRSTGRKARQTRLDANGKRIAPQAGKPLAVRLVVSRILDKDGKVLAE